MKLTVFAKQLNEDAQQISISKSLEADMLGDRKMLDLLAEKIQNQGFPEKFSLPVKTSTGVEIVFTYELYEKSINEDKGHHTITFTYEHTRDTVVKIRTMLKDAEKNDDDKDGEAFDKLADELNVADIIHIMADVSDKITKVWASNK